MNMTDSGNIHLVMCAVDARSHIAAIIFGWPENRKEPS